MDEKHDQMIAANQLFITSGDYEYMYLLIQILKINV
jgi:hypothetical protein